MKKIILILFFLFSILPIKIWAQSSNAGFVPGNIWYSIDPFSEGDKIKIYTIIFNSDDKQLSGTVVFFDNTTFLGKKDFVVEAKGIKDVSIDWTVTVGDHTIFAKIENAKFLVSAGKYEEVYLEKSESVKSKNTVSKKIILPTKKENADTEDNIGEISAIENIQNLIVEKTPDFIAKPISAAVVGLDTFREDTALLSINKKEEVKKQIESIKMESSSVEGEQNKSSVLKPFKYVELFFLTIFSYILSNKFLFYIILAGTFFLILRFIWRKIF